jgi:hypothetical protein
MWVLYLLYLKQPGAAGWGPKRKSRLSFWQAGVGQSGAWGSGEDTGIGTEPGRRGVVDQIKYKIITSNLEKSM